MNSPLPAQTKTQKENGKPTTFCFFLFKRRWFREIIIPQSNGRDSSFHFFSTTQIASQKSNLSHSCSNFIAPSALSICSSATRYFNFKFQSQLYVFMFICSSVSNLYMLFFFKVMVVMEGRMCWETKYAVGMWSCAMKVCWIKMAKKEGLVTRKRWSMR